MCLSLQARACGRGCPREPVKTGASHIAAAPPRGGEGLSGCSPTKKPNWSAAGRHTSRRSAGSLNESFPHLHPPPHAGGAASVTRGVPPRAEGAEHSPAGAPHGPLERSRSRAAAALPAPIPEPPPSLSLVTRIPRLTRPPGPRADDLPRSIPPPASLTGPARPHELCRAGAPPDRRLSAP